MSRQHRAALEVMVRDLVTASERHRTNNPRPVDQWADRHLVVVHVGEKP